ncbi:MAG: deoxyribonuclease V [Thermodesulfobacteriota bacterium]
MWTLEDLNTDKIPTYKEALIIQKELQRKIITKNQFNEIKTIAGIDLAQFRKDKKLVCGIIVFSYPELKEVERAWETADEKFPYIPGLLAFREGPAIFQAFLKIKKRPDLLMIDGHGIAHPRGCGIASHVGVVLDIPSIGVAKQRLFGKYWEPGQSQGAWTPLISNNGKNIGAVIRSKQGTKPIFVSIGNKIDLETSVKITLNSLRGFRLPEPTRLADAFVAQLKSTVSS